MITILHVSKLQFDEKKILRKNLSKHYGFALFGLSQLQFDEKKFL